MPRPGEQAERDAERYLGEHGLRLIERNFRCRAGEIDLVMREADTLVFVEVRERRNGRYGSGADSVDFRKRRRIVIAAQFYLQRLKPIPACRFDVVSIDGRNHLDWIKNAFEAD